MSSGKGRKIRWRMDHEKAVLTDNFDARGWVPSGPGDDWNFYWATIHTVKALFHPDTGTRLSDAQIVNHFPNHYELTRKDLMAKNVKRYLKEHARSLMASAGAGQSVAVQDFLPATYALPQDYGVFVEEFRRCPQGTTWIMKPSGKSQGTGIFLVDKLSQVKRWARDSGRAGAPGSDSYVVSRYIERPLLVGGKKFDLRLYILVTSWRPLMAYRYKQGFARFCAVKYSSGDLGNTFVHLTNVAVQKKGRDYDETNGGKWNTSSFWLYIESTRGRAAARKLEEDIDLVFLLSLKACQNAVSNDPHCFEVYGFDIIVDEDLKPWLIEVNASPSLSSTTESDRRMKAALISDTLSIVVPPDFPEPRGRGGVNVYPREDTDMGDYEILYDEAAEVEAERGRRETEAAGKYGGGRRSASTFRR